MEFDNFHFMKHKNANQNLRGEIAERVIELMNLSKEDTIFDIGAGDGFYSSKFADLCKKVVSIEAYGKNFEGELYAEDNIVKIEADICEWIKINDFCEATHIFFSNSFHDMECQDGILDKISSSLKKGGHLDLIEFNLKATFGPPKNIRFSKEALKSKVEKYGFEEKEYNDFENHYFISFEKM